MIITSILSLLLSTSVTLRRDMSILFNRVATLALIYCILQETTCLSFVSKGLGLHGGLLHITNITQIFNIFVFFISILILQLTSFYPRKVWISEYSSLKDLLFNKFMYYRTKITNKMGEYMKILEYPEEQLGKLLLLWDQLSNSGKALKLLIPNLVEFYHGGWINYSCTVISQKIQPIYKGAESRVNALPLVLEKEIGDRGSKSTTFKNAVVKEQRVDGSYMGVLFVNHPMLRYTLRGFERITYYNGIPSNQILIKRYYTTKDSSINPASELSSTRPNKESFNLNPWFITGFTDGDGSFSVSITKKKSGTGWKIQPVFSIGLDIKDLDILVQFKTFFNAGKIYTSKRGIVYFTIGSTKDLIKHVLPHFDKYPLLSLKLKYYLVFKEILLLMEKGEHNSLPGLLKIFSLRANLNKGLPKVVVNEYPDLKPANVPKFKTASTLNPNWLAGFISAEASFFISLYPNKNRKAGYAVSLSFSLSQHLKDICLLERIANYLGCGIVKKHGTRESAELVITPAEDINQKLIPLLSKHTLSGVKLLDFERFKKVALLIESKSHLKPEGVKLIKDIKDAMYKREL